jgi:tetratricopeptide (TPR) repeat protein
MAKSLNKLVGKYPRLLAELAMLTLELGESKKAIKILDKFQKKYPKDIPGQLVRGALLEYIGELESADKIYRDIIAREPKNMRAITRLYLMAKDRKDPSDYWLKSLMNVDPLSPLLTDYIYVAGEEESPSSPEGTPIVEELPSISEEAPPPAELPHLDTIQEKLETLEKRFEMPSEEAPAVEVFEETIPPSETETKSEDIPEVSVEVPAEITPETPAEIQPEPLPEPSSEVPSQAPSEVQPESPPEAPLEAQTEIPPEPLPEIVPESPVEFIIPEETLERGVQISLDDLKVEMEIASGKTQTEVEPKAEPSIEVEPKAEPAIEVEPKAEPSIEVEPKAEPAIEVEPKAEPQTEAATKIEPTAIAEPTEAIFKTEEEPPLDESAYAMPTTPPSIDLDEFQRVYKEIDDNQIHKRTIPEMSFDGVIPSATLAEIYAGQGNIQRALEIYFALPDEELQNHADRIKELSAILSNPADGRSDFPV